MSMSFSMENPDPEKPSSDGLEITSIGSLYGGGPWDKKYWSCSRGKDRYPYPIGYHASRTHTGNTCRMEIHEGLRGPLFVITSMNGDKCFGQTPDIAWENFLKKNGPRVKTWHAKRFSCKIDGVELFGFRNPFVLRLLRQLVTNDNGTAEQSLSSNFCNGASRLDHEKRSPESCTYPDLLPYLGRRQSTGKRSRKQKSNAKNATSELSLKRSRTQDLLNDAKVGIARERIRGNGGSYEGHEADHFHDDNSSNLLDMTIEYKVPHHHLIQSQKENSIPVNDRKHYPTSLEQCTDDKYMSVTSSKPDINCVMHEYPGTVPVPIDLVAVVGRSNDPFVVRDDLHLGPPIVADCFVEKTTFPQEKRELVASEKHRLTHVASEISIVSKNPLDRSSDVDLQVVDSLTAAEENEGEILIPTELKPEKDLEYHVPDTLDSLQDNNADCALGSHKGSPYNGEEELVGAEQLLRNSTSHTHAAVAYDVPNESNGENMKCSLNCVDAAPKILQEMSFHVVLAAEPVLSQGQIMESHPEEDMVTSGNSNTSSEKSDSDLNLQELLKSMMTVLLPQAVPLLKKTSKKRSAIARNTKISFTKCKPQLNLMELKSNKENDGIHSLTDIISQGELTSGMPTGGFEIDRNGNLHGADTMFRTEKVDPVVCCKANVPFGEIGALEDMKSVIPDSLEDDQTAHDASNHRPLHSYFFQADHTPFDKKVCSVDVLGSHGDANGVKGSSNCHSGTDGNNEIIQDEVAMLPEKGDILISDSPLCCMSPEKQIPVEEETDKEGMNRIENALRIEVQINLADGLPNYQGFRSNKIAYSSGLVPLSSNVEQFEQPLLPSAKNLATVNNEVPETIVKQIPHAHGSPGTDTNSIYVQQHLTMSDVDKISSATDRRDGEIKAEIGTIHAPRMGFNGKTAAVATCDASNQRSDVATSTGYYTLSSHPSRKYNGPLSESIICRNIKDCVKPEAFSSMDATETDQTIASKHLNWNISLSNEAELDKEHYLKVPKGIPEAEGMFNTDPVASQNHAMVIQAAEDIRSQSAFGHSVPYVKRHEVDAVVNELVASYRAKEGNSSVSHFQEQGVFLSSTNGSSVKEVEIGSDDLSCSKLQKKNLVLDRSSLEVNKPSNEIEGFVELVGCCVHPTPVLSILLRRKGDDIHICVFCGHLGDNDRTLFIYKVSIKEVEKTDPLFLGYTSIMLPLSKATFDSKIAFERSGIQFAPADRCLVLLNSIKAPCCREQNINCLCSACTSDCCEENAVKVLHVQLGYVSVVAKLTTAESVYCILACEPCYLIAVEESGRLHVWVMSSTWSVAVDDFILPSFDYLCPSVMELKRIPKCALVVGHNGVGGFGLWDISKRILVARFSGPGYSIFQAIPIGLFCWQTTNSKVDEHIKEIIASTEMWFSGDDVEHCFLPPNEEDRAVWLLVSAAPDSDVQSGYPAMNCNMSPTGWWRLALLVKNTVIMGSILDSRASALDASGGHGIIGTCDGLVYIWELSTGKKLANLHDFKGGGVSCIATEAESGTLAVADNEGNLLVYIQHPRNSEVKEPNGS